MVVVWAIIMDSWPAIAIVFDGLDHLVLPEEIFETHVHNQL